MESYFRHPKTLGERKKSDDREVAAFVRPKRRPKNLPTDWSDIQRGLGGKKPRYKDHRR